MAEVLKKTVEDKYNTESIKKNLKKNEKKKVTTNKNEGDSKKNKNQKQSFIESIRIFCSGVANEFKRVHWTTKENMVKYSVATIFFIIFFSVFFSVIDVLFAALINFIRTLF